MNTVLPLLLRSHRTLFRGATLPIFCFLVFLLVLSRPGLILADSFQYDDSGRLLFATQGNGLTHGYIYDAEANILDATVSSTDQAPGGGPGNGIADWWEDFYFGTQGIDPTEKDDDGISWLLKFGLGLEPGTDSTSMLPTIEVGSGDASLTFRRSRFGDDLEYVVQSSSDLASWTDWATETEALFNAAPLPGLSDDLAQTFRLTIPYSGDRFFLRLRVNNP